MATPPDELFHRQERELMRYTDGRIKRLLRMMEAARLEMQATISDSKFDQRRIQSLTAQLDRIQADLERQIQGMGQASPEVAKMAKAHLETSTTIIAELEISIPFDKLNTEVLMRFSDVNLSQLQGLSRYQQQTIKNVLFNKVGIKGENPVRVAKELAGRSGKWQSMYPRLETIMRTETSNIYNAQSVEALQYATETYGVTMNKRIIETIDGVRNHPISLLLNGMVVEPDGKYKVSVAAVIAKAAKLKRGAGGVLWPVIDGHYVGSRLPAHYNERGIIVPTNKPVNQQDSTTKSDS